MPNQYLATERDSIKQKYLEALYSTGFNKRLSCQIAGVDRITIRNWERSDPDFASEVESVLVMLAEECISVVLHDAIIGINGKPPNPETAKWILERLVRHYGFELRKNFATGEAKPIQITIKRASETPRRDDAEPDE